MKKKIELILSVSIITLFLMISIVPAQNLSYQIKIPFNKIDFEDIYSLTFYEKDFNYKKIFAYDFVELNNGGQLTDIGKPSLPFKNIVIALPQGIKATNVKILNIDEKEIPGSFNIIPIQVPKKISTFSTNLDIISYDSTIYTSNEKYPTKYADLDYQTDLAGQGLAVITIYPVHFIPILHKLYVITSIEFVIEGVDGYIYGDYLSDSISKYGIESYQKIIEEMVVNPEDIKLQKSFNDPEPLGVPPGDYDYVIITTTNWVDDFQPLANWKTKKGIPANIVTTDWIYSNYVGSSNEEKIRAFVKDAYINWGTTYFLLGGDTTYIPYYTAYYVGDNIPTDTYYSDYDDDWTLEVNVGRASVNQEGTSAGGIGNFVNKILSYEKNPPTTNYAKNVALFGFDLDSTSHGADCKIDIDNLYIPSDWTVTKVYDTDSGNHEDAVDTAVNAGQNLINHIDHSNWNVMGVGYVNHNYLLDTSETDAFSNGNKQSTWYSIGCWASAYDYDNCIAEHFVRDTNGGGVSFVGNSRYGWYYQGSDDLASLRYDRYFFKSLFSENQYKLGNLFSDHKMDSYASMDPDEYNKYIFTELTLLGDPEMPIWTNNPSSFSVNHPSSIPTGLSSFTVHVEKTGGTNVNNAYVCLWKSSEVYLTGYTNIAGDVTLYPSPSTPGTMYVTVTKQNFLPYEGNAQVIQGVNHPPYIPSNPSPANGAIDVSINKILSWVGGDPDQGDTVLFDVYFGTNNPPPLVSFDQTHTSYDPGTMNFNTLYYWMIVSKDNHGASNSSPVWSFTTKMNSPPNQPNTPSPTNGATNVNINANLSWICSDPDDDPLTYNVCFGTTSNPPLIATTGYTHYYPDTMDYETTYYWRIIAFDNWGTSTSGPIWNFTTESIPQNLPPIYSNENPEDNSIDISVNISSLNIIIKDPEGDSFSWSIETSPNIGSNSGTNENNGTKTCNILGLEYNKIYKWYVNTTDSESGESIRKTYKFTTASNYTLEPDLDCNGVLSWANVKPGSTINGDFHLTNVGESGSKLDWEIVEWPEWGTWTFSALQGNDLKPEDGPVIISITISAPNQANQQFTGEVKIVNTENIDDYDTISVSLTNPRTIAMNLPFLKFLENHPNIFPLLQRLLLRLEQ